MARGEHGGEVPARSGVVGLWAVLGVVALLSLWCTVSALRSCDGGVAPPIAPSPLADVQRAFAALGDRDGAATPHAARGYVSAEAPHVERELPFDFTTDGLDGLCGVVELVPDATSRIARASLGDRALVPHDRGVSFAACGVRAGRADGTGRAWVRTWVMPGLTPADVAASELPDEVVLALAEAEHVLHASGWQAGREALVIERASFGPRWEPPRPASGCVAWVVVGVGLELLRAERGVEHVHTDTRRGRQLLGAVSCHDGGEVVPTGPANEGTLYALPFDRSGGPRVPSAPGTLLTTVGAVRRVRPEALTLPAGE